MLDNLADYLQTELNHDDDLTTNEVSDHLDILTGFLYYEPQLRNIFRKVCHQYHVIDPDDIDHYQYNKAKYDQAWDQHSDIRWFTNSNYQPVNETIYFDLLDSLAGQLPD